MPIAFPISMMLLAGAIAGVASLRLVKRRCQLVTLALAAVVGLFVHRLYFANHLVAAKILPFANAIFWSNLQPIFVGILAGVGWARMNTPRWQRLFLVIPLCALGVYRTIEPVIGAPATLGEPRISNQIVRQSTKSSCSAAACATALNSIGITASEQEMAELCLTKERGTFMLGIFRGLKLKTDGTAYRVEVFSGSLDEFLSLPPAPAIASITVAGDRQALLGASHSVMISPVTGDEIEIGDPFSGRYKMKRDALKAIWQQEALRLVRR